MKRLIIAFAALTLTAGAVQANPFLRFVTANGFKVGVKNTAKNHGDDLARAMRGTAQRKLANRAATAAAVGVALHQFGGPKLGNNDNEGQGSFAPAPIRADHFLHGEYVELGDLNSL